MIVAVLSLFGVAIGLVTAFTVTGRALLVVVGCGDRPLSTATLVGAAAIVCWLSAAALIVPPGSVTAVVSVGVGVAVLVGVALVRRQDLLPTDAQRWSFAGALVAGAAALAPFLVLVGGARSTAFVHLGTNHDGFFFTAMPRWLLDHRAVGSARVGAGGSPGGVGLVGSVWDRYQDMSLRYGADALTAAVSRISRIDPLDLWLPVTATFASMIGVAAHRVVSVLGRPGWWAMAAAATVATSTTALRAVSDQHTPTILAIALVLCLLAEVEHTTAGRPGATPPVVLALLLTAVAAVYGEVLTLAGPPLACLVLVRAVRGGTRDWQRWVRVPIWAAVLGAPIWWRTLRGATAINVPDGYASPYGPTLTPFAVVRNMLVNPIDLSAAFASSPWVSRIGVVLLGGLVVAGLVAVSWRGRARPWWLTLIVVAVTGWWAFGRDGVSGYRQTRWVEWAVPLLLLGALVGWTSVADRVDRITGPSRARAGAARSFGVVVLGLATLGLAVPGIESIARLRDSPARRVDAAFGQAVTWLERRDPTGASTVVWSADYFTNLWTPYVLEGAPDTAYLSIYRDYYAVDHYGSLRGRRWLLLDTTARESATLTPGSVVARNARFTLVDLTVGAAHLVVEPRYHGRWSEREHPVSVTLGPTLAACTTDAKVVPCP